MANVKKVDLEIEGMHCNSCASGIQMVLQSTDGVLSASASYDSKRARLSLTKIRLALIQ